MYYYVYYLKSKIKPEETYIGFTSNLKQRDFNLIAMRYTMSKIFLDSNILIYLYTSTEPQKNKAIQIV